MTRTSLRAIADALEACALALRECPEMAPAIGDPLPLPTSGTWVTPRQFSERQPAFPLGTIRGLLAAREANGLLEQGIVKEVLDRKVVLDEARFLAWLLREPCGPQTVGRRGRPQVLPLAKRSKG